MPSPISKPCKQLEIISVSKCGTVTAVGVTADDTLVIIRYNRFCHEAQSTIYLISTLGSSVESFSINSSSNVGSIMFVERLTDGHSTVRSCTFEEIKNTLSSSFKKVSNATGRNTPNIKTLVSTAPSVTVKLFGVSKMIVCSKDNSKHSFRLVDTVDYNNYNYDDDHGFERCRLIDCESYVLLLGSHQLPQEEAAAFKKGYKVLAYDRRWRQIASKKFWYSKKYMIDWVTNIERLVWIIFSNKQLIVFDMDLKEDSKPVCQREMPEMPGRIEPCSRAKKMIIAYDSSISISSSKGIELKRIDIGTIYDIYDINIVDNLSTMYILSQRFSGGNSTQDSEAGQGIELEEYNLQKVNLTDPDILTPVTVKLFSTEYKKTPMTIVHSTTGCFIQAGDRINYIQ